MVNSGLTLTLNGCGNEMSDYRYLEYRFDADRVERAKELQVLTQDADGVLLADHHYMVAGGNEPHYVMTKPHPDCDCHDFSWGHDRLCKHLIAALYHEGDQHISYIVDAHNKAGVLTKRVMEVTILAGPPFGGQSEYVRRLAKEGDFIWQYDAVMPAVTFGLAPYGLSVTTKEIVRKMRDAAIKAVANAREHPKNEIEHAWIIGSYPSSKSRHDLAAMLKGEVLVFKSQPESCAVRAEMAGLDSTQVKRVKRYAENWWETFTPHPNDIEFTEGKD